MRRTIVVLFVVMLVAAGVPGCQWFEAGNSQEAAEFGLVPVSSDTPPSWQLERVGGGRLALNDLKGQVALLYFWTTW